MWCLGSLKLKLMWQPSELMRPYADAYLSGSYAKQVYLEKAYMSQSFSETDPEVGLFTVRGCGRKPFQASTLSSG